MLTKQIILNRLITKKPKFEQLGISVLGLFGSYSRSEQNPNSDIDIFVDFKSKEETYDNFIELCFLLDSMFANKKVEVVTKKGLSKFIGHEILNEVVYV